jgi:hypothetical protein
VKLGLGTGLTYLISSSIGILRTPALRVIARIFMGSETLNFEPGTVPALLEQFAEATDHPCRWNSFTVTLLGENSPEGV